MVLFEFQIHLRQFCRGKGGDTPSAQEEGGGSREGGSIIVPGYAALYASLSTIAEATFSNLKENPPTIPLIALPLLLLTSQAATHHPGETL